MTQYLSAVKASEIAGVAQQTIINHINKGTLKASPVRESNSDRTNKWMISEDDLLEWMENRPKRERTAKMDTYLEESYTDEEFDDFAKRFATYLFKRLQDAYNKGVKDGEQRMKSKMINALKEEQ